MLLRSIRTYLDILMAWVLFSKVYMEGSAMLWTQHRILNFFIKILIALQVF